MHSSAGLGLLSELLGFESFTSSRGLVPTVRKRPNAGRRQAVQSGGNG